MYTTVILVLSVIFALGVCYVFKNNQKGLDTFIKILTIVFCALGILRFHLSDSFPEAVFSGSDIPGTLLRWGSHISYAVLPMSVFFDSRLFKNAAIYFSLPVAILCAFNFEHLMEYFLSPLGNGWDTEPSVRYALYITELVLMIAVPLLTQRRDSHVFNVKDRAEWQNLALGLPAMLLYMMPAYIPQALFGKTDIAIESFSPLHLLWIVLIPLEIVIIYLYFRNRSKEDKWVLCAFLILAQFFHTNSVFLRGFKFSRVPLQLCCLAAFLYLIILLTKNRRLFDFCYIANMIGALVAVVLIDFSVGALQFWNIHYIYEHTMVIVFPIVALALGVFPRLDRTSLKSMYLIFSCYFLFCLIIGLAINAFSGNPGCEVNYFYMFDYDIAISYIPFVTFTGAIKLTLGPVTVYPILVGVVYVAFIIICTLYYLLNRGIYKLIDTYKAKRLPKAEIEKVQV